MFLCFILLWLLVIVVDSTDCEVLEQFLEEIATANMSQPHIVTNGGGKISDDFEVMYQPVMAQCIVKVKNLALFAKIDILVALIEVQFTKK